MTIDLKSVLESKGFRTVLTCTGILVILLIVFKMGEFVGARKADFSQRWGEHYYANFMGPRPGFPMGIDAPRTLIMGHGIAGSVVSVGDTSFAVRGSDAVERIIAFTGDTQFQRYRDTIATSEVAVGDNVIVLGTPDDEGRILAKFVRVVPELPVPFDEPWRGGMMR